MSARVSDACERVWASVCVYYEIGTCGGGGTLTAWDHEIGVSPNSALIV